ncbi:hypothetical protein V3481_002413 [Fusarium oxysporum f. sp. vasinfectum]|uniref:VWFA domain-containing protein n=1 Tax=Fusarium oxysporum f. sp. vasinfectum 25433 TaxID=1089449 RepID=X0M7V3_FUSOX|nr:hypothetical protein FOTG_02694 [Fusarium oxysporum f. sp. vasinfectum 25433]
MTSRHVFTQRLKSGVLFSAPGNMLAMPEGGWGDDTPMNRSRKPKKKVKNRGLDQFSHWVAKVTPFDEPYDDIGSFTPDKDTRNSEYRPYSIPPYPEPPVRPEEAEIPEVTLCLPMLSVSLTATVDGTVAHTELVQKFHNPSDEMIDAAKHVFPLYDGAVITSFECTIGDERRVRGVVKPKAQARKEFEEAVRDRVAAPALLEEHTPEIFETSLGNIPANTTVEINITYVQELKVVMMETEATEGIALTIPMSIAPRYSKSPIEWEPASRVPEEKLDIWIKVMDNGKINHEGCDEESGYLLQFEGSKSVEYSNMLEKDASTRIYYVWHHESQPPVLRKDFVFVIQMNEDHQIKSGAIACAADDKGLAAMRVNIRPNDLFRNAIIPQSFTGEILFLLDQSGSMGWSNDSPGYGRRRTGGRKIDVMREAMLLALSGIPSTCIFNIISWGSATVGLWENSQPHTQENIREAKSYVSQMEADMGGTDLLRALEAVVKRRVQERESTQIIILTDGELEPEDSIQFIWKKRQLFGDKVRFFALGIGDEVSHRLVESIAECGGGYSDVVHTTQTPRWHDRLNRLLKSALEPNSWSCDIDLGSGFERKNLVDYNLGQDTPADGSNIPYIEAPFPISSLHPFSFASISFLIDLRHGGAIPKTVTINTTTPGAKRKTYELPIEISSGSDGTIHRLVAKSVLLDLQDQIKRGETETAVAKANAETIGTMYSITSNWTSFVAVSENQPTQTVEEQKMNHYKALFDEIDIDELLNNVDDDEYSSSGSSGGYGYGYGYGSPRLSSMGGPSTYNFPMIPGEPFRNGRVLESANHIPIPAPMPMCAPAPPSSAQIRSMSNSRGRHRKLMERSLDEDSDEPETLHPAGIPPCLSLSELDSELEVPQDSYASLPLSRSQMVFDRPSEVLERRPWERPASTESQARAKSVDYDVTMPSRQLVYGDSSSSVYASQDIPLILSDSSYQEAERSERLERTPANTTDDVTPHSISDSPTAEDSLLHQPRDPPLDDIAKLSAPETYDSVPDSTQASTSAEFMSSPPSPLFEALSEVKSGYVGAEQGFRVVGARQNVSSSRLSPVDGDRQIIAPDVSPPSGEPSSPGCASQSARVNVPPSPPLFAYSSRGGYAGGLGSRVSARGGARGGRGGGPGAHYSSHRPQTIPNPPPLTPGAYSNDTNMSATYIPELHEAFFEHGSSASGNAGPWCSDHDSDHDERSQSNFGSPSPPPKVYGPLDWQFAMECQDGQGFFDLSGKTQYLHLHFCPETAKKFGPKISELLHNSTTLEQERDDISARVLDTLMMIECYKTHRAQEEDTWDLMMERAWDAVISVLGLSDEEEELEELAGQLRGAMMHAHYIAATGVTGSEKDGHTVNTVRCPACNVVWRTTRRFWCPFDHDYDNEADEILNWDDFWKHQVGRGHVVCIQAVMY